MGRNSIPILAYTQVRPGGSVTPEAFEQHLMLLQEKGWGTCFLQEVLDFVRGESSPDAPVAAITLDGATLDNWVYAFPLLVKYGAKATVFVITSRPGSGKPRANAGEFPAESLLQCAPLEQAHREAVGGDGTRAQFCNWEELKSMAESGLVEVQALGHTHAACFADDVMVRLNQGKETWALTTMTDGDERIGVPVYPWRSALASYRYSDDQGLRDEAVRMLADGAKAKRIVAELNERLAVEGLGQFEGAAEREERVMGDLAQSRRLIAKQIGLEPTHFCYPWGHVGKSIQDMVCRSGFLSGCTLTAGGNYPGVDPYLLRRILVRTSSTKWLRRRLSICGGRRRSKVYAWFSGFRGQSES